MKTILLMLNRIRIAFCLLLLLEIEAKAQTELPLTYSPDSWVNSTITKGDTLIVGGYFSHVGKYTGGGALLSTTSDEPNMNFPKINGVVKASTPDGVGGFYVYGEFNRESETPSVYNERIEHILPDNSFDPNFSIEVEYGGITYMFFYKGILYIGSWAGDNGKINGQTINKLAGLNVSTKTMVSWLPSVTQVNGNTQVERIFASGNTLYFIGRFDKVGGVDRRDIASITIGTGIVKSWYPGNNWENYYYYSDLVFYKDKVIIAGFFSEHNLSKQLACALVDTLTGQNFTYMFNSDCNNSPGSCLYTAAHVKRVIIKNDVLYAFSRGTFDTRITALNLNAFVSSLQNGTMWHKYFNMIADPADMAIIDNSLFVMGNNFEEVYLTNTDNISDNNIERKIKGGVKLNIHTGALEDWFPDPVGSITNEVKTMSVFGDKIFTGGLFTHLKGVERKGVYMMNARTETILPFNMDLLWADVGSLKLVGNTLYVEGSLRSEINVKNSILSFDVNTGERLTWAAPDLGVIINKIEVSDKYVFVGGSFSYQGKQNLIAIDRSTGQINSWLSNPNLSVETLHIANNQLYVGGQFSNLSGQIRNRVASYNLSDLTLTEWNPNTNSIVNSIYTKNGIVWIGGSFSSVGGINKDMIAAVDPNSGAIAFNTNAGMRYSSILSIISKGCKLFVGGNFILNSQYACNTLAINNLNNNTFTPTNNFCLNLQTTGTVRIHTLSVIEDDLFFGGYFTKINANTKNPYLGRIRFPTSYFTPCEIGNCNNALSLASTADDYTTGTYIQKTNQEISATNKVGGDSEVTLRSNKSILLLPNTANTSGFVAKPTNGGSFKAEIAPCN